MIVHKSFLVLALLPLLSAIASKNSSSTTLTPSKPKRTLSDQIYSHGDAKAVVFYMENPQTSELPELQAAASSPGLRNFYSSAAKPLALVSVQQPIQVFEQDSPKQVAEQQVLYEFQQTPTNAVSNVHVKQLFEPNNIDITTPPPLYQGQPSDQLSITQPLSSIHPATPIITAGQFYPRPQANGLYSASNHHPATSPTVVSPVHHNIYTNHGLNTGPYNNYNNPLYPEAQQYQNTHISQKQTPGKYIYLNGKIVYSPVHLISQQTKIPANSIYHKGAYHNQQKLPLLNYSQRHNAPVNQQHGVLGSQYRVRPQGRLPANLPPITNNGFQPPNQFQTINKPSAPVQQEESEDDEERPVNEEDGEESDEEEEDVSESKDDEKDTVDHEGDDAFEYESFPFEEDDYLEDDESHYFKPPNYRKGKSRGRQRNEEHEHDLDDDRKDAKRGASKQHSKYYHYPSHSRNYRNQPNYNSGENYGFYEGYSSNSKYKMPKQGKKNERRGEKPIGKYKKVKYSKVKGGRPKVETIEGRFSENIPVTHKQKVYKERWYVTKDIDGALSKKLKNIK